MTGVRPAKIAILGCGARGRVYAAYAASHPDEIELAGVADPDAGLDEYACKVWKSWRDLVDSDIQLDAVVVALPDRFHRDAAIASLRRGWHVLLEKPFGCSWRECLDIRNAQERSGKLVLAGYVLRYAPYYRRLKALLATGAIGEIVSIHHLAAISYAKAAHAFCRGSWAREADGTGTLVQKCSHDFDLVDWWSGPRRCARISSFGSLVHWRASNKPQRAADRCLDCPADVRLPCPWDAGRLYLAGDSLRYHFKDRSDEAMKAVVADSRYGRCVYSCGNDTVDHQTVLMEYEGGLSVTLEMESFSKDRGRFTRFYGTRGEMYADGGTIAVKPFAGAEWVVEPPGGGRHGGGDEGIVAAFLRFMRRSTPARAGKIFLGALESHRLAFLAEESRKTHRTVECGEV